MGFYTVYRQNRTALTRADEQKAKSETKLAIVGCILFVLTFLCAVFCVFGVVLKITRLETMMGKSSQSLTQF